VVTLSARAVERRAPPPDGEPHDRSNTSAAPLKIVVIDGEGAVNIIQQQSAVAPVVEVRDRNDQPDAVRETRSTARAQRGGEPEEAPPPSEVNEGLLSRIFASWNQLDGWLRQLSRLRFAA
jgi:hypothetical protein